MNGIGSEIVSRTELANKVGTSMSRKAYRRLFNSWLRV